MDEVRLRIGIAAIWMAVSASALLAWEASRLDWTLARWAGSSAGFPWRDDWWLTTVMHGGAHKLSWVVMTALCLGVWWPFGPLRRIGLSERLQLAVSAMAAALIVSLLKRGSGASCPWDLAPFGGTVAPVSHWVAFLQPDGGGGHCFPAGHASSGFAFVSGWFAFRRRAPHVAWAWLISALMAGFALGLSQQLRGAHLMSHTLWTLWVCTVSAWAVDRVWRLQMAARRTA